MPKIVPMALKEPTLYNYIYRSGVFLMLDKNHLHEKDRRHYAEKIKKQAARAPHSEHRKQAEGDRETREI